MLNVSFNSNFVVNHKRHEWGAEDRKVFFQVKEDLPPRQEGAKGYDAQSKTLRVMV